MNSPQQPEGHDRQHALLRHRPIFGGVFGTGRYALASIPCVMNGLHAVRFMVIDPTSGAVISLADGKTEALDAARNALQADQVETSDEQMCQAELWPDCELAVPRPLLVRAKPISKRRRDIFAKSNGRCHYCAAPLLLDGVWHIEHMLPRAIGGRDEICNLVAACRKCNLAKSDRTALEFIASSIIDGREAR